MDDPIRPSKVTFNRVLSNSHNEWSSHLRYAEAMRQLPPYCIDLKRLLRRTPSFLRYGLVPGDAEMLFACVEKESSKGQFGLLISGHSLWTTSHGQCRLEPKIMSLDILLAGSSPLTVYISDYGPLGEWPGVYGVSDHDDGNYISVLFLAWAYILSARWAEALKHASGHQCVRNFRRDSSQLAEDTDNRNKVEINIGNNVEAAEADWWQAILCSGWEITTDYNQNTYMSPWSVLLSNKARIKVTTDSPITQAEPPSSSTALEYLARFCSRHRLYGQCSAALAAALYIPFLHGKSVSLPVPKPALGSGSSCVSLSQSSSDLVHEHSEFLSHYMTLSCNVWGLRSLLCSTFFNAEIECNLVSAWLNPAFAILNPLLKGENNLPMLAKVLGSRHPGLASLWLGAIIMGVAKPTLRDIRLGLTAMELNAAAWTGTEQSFITTEPGISDGQMIRREDECRLLFITACDGYTRPPIHPWKPFGETRLRDTELPVQQHACCCRHYLSYEIWHWNLANGQVLRDPGISLMGSGETNFVTRTTREDYPIHHDSSLFSESASEVATRGIFGWLRSTGYPANEKPLYQHPWIAIESSDDDEDDDDGEKSDICQETDCPSFISEWLSGVD